MEPAGRIEHRTEPRYPRLLPVRIGNVRLTTANVSLHGMQIVCPVMLFKRIKADAKRGELSAQVALPRGEPFSATLSVRYCSEYKDEVLVGVRLALIDADAQAQWAAYIAGLSGGQAT